MNEFITYRETINEKLEYYVLQKSFPHYQGRIVNYPVEGAIINTPIAGYNLWITFANTLRGNFIPAFKGVGEEIEHVFSNMSNWFLSERISKEPKKYEKFKLK